MNMAKLNPTSLWAATIIIVALLFCLVPSAHASSRVRMKQLIVPLNCLFDEVNDGSGAVVYLTPETCGTLVRPQQPTPTPSAPTQPQPVPSEYYSGNIYLDSFGGRTSQNGYVLVVRPGLIYSFRLPGDSPVGAPRTLEITSIRDGAVTITFGPGDRQVTLREGQRFRANIAYDDEADVDITVLRIQDDGSAVIHVKFPKQPRLDGRVFETNHTMIAILILMLLTGAALYVHAHSRYRTRHTHRRSDGWHIEETIK